MEDKGKLFKGRSVALVMIILGWILSAYLFLRYFQLRNKEQDTIDFCKAIFNNSCDTTLTSTMSWQLKFPLVGWGLAYFGLLALLFSIGTKLLDRFVILLAAFGVGVSCILTTILIRGSLICPLCFVIHLINIAVLIALIVSTRSSLYFNPPKRMPTRRSYLWGSLLIIFVITGGFTEVRILKSFVPNIPKVDLSEAGKKFKGEKVYNIPKSASSPHLGSIDAPVQLVVFSSFQCPSCKVFASVIEDLQKNYGKGVCITFKNFPLSTNCNPMLAENEQPRSCDAAFAALAANQQNKFWSYHDQLFKTDLSDDEETLASIAKNAGLNMEQWEQDRHSDELKKQLAEDIKTAYRIGINATPTVLINGRKVNNPSENILNLLIENELQTISR